MKLKNLVLIAAVSLMAVLPRVSFADQLEDILSAGKLRVGIIMDLAPFGYTDASGEAAGIDVTLAGEIARQMGVTLEIVPVIGSSRIPSLIANKVDILIAAMGSNPERAMQIAFSRPYVSVDLGVFGPSSIGFTRNLADLDAYSIGVAKGTTLDLSMSDVHPDGNYMRFDDAAPTIAAFLAGQTDLVAENSAIIANVAKENPDKDLTLLYRIRQSPAHIGVKRGEQNLLNWINTTLFFLRMNGSLAAMQKEWFGAVSDLPHM